MIRILIYLLLFFTTSCIRNADVIPEIPEDKKIFVYCILDVNSVETFVSINTTYGYYEKQKTDIDRIFGEKYSVKNAIVTLHNGEKSAQLSFDPSREVYTIASRDFSIIEGKKYYLDIQTDGHRIIGECTVPKHCDEFKATLKEIYKNSKYIVDYSFKKNNSSLYEIKGSYDYLISKNEKDTLIISYLGFPDLSSSRPDNYLSYKYFKNSEEISDRFSNSTSTIESPSHTYEIHPPILQRIELILVNYEENAAKFNLKKGFVNTDPFGEPSPINYNIQGGIGIFGAKTSQTIEVEIN